MPNTSESHMQSSSRNEYKAKVLEWCSAEPQPGELFLVWNTGNKYRYPQIWVMEHAMSYKRLRFTIHRSASLLRQPNGVKVNERFRPQTLTITQKSWNALREGDLVVYKGRHIPNDTRTTNKKAGKARAVQLVLGRTE